MIIDLPDSEVTTVWLGFDDFDSEDHEHIEDTVISAKQWLRDETGWHFWRFDSLRLDWHRKRVEIDFARMQAQC